MGREETCHLILLYVLLLNYKVLCVYFCWYTCHVLACTCTSTSTGTGGTGVLVLVLEWYWYWSGTGMCNCTGLVPYAACCLLPVACDG